MTQPTIKPPYADMVKTAKWRRFFAERGYHDPDYILVKVTQPKADDWWALDDRARTLIGDDYRTTFVSNGQYFLVRATCMDRLIEGFEDKADRLEFRRLPERPA